MTNDAKKKRVSIVWTKLTPKVKGLPLSLGPFKTALLLSKNHIFFVLVHHGTKYLYFVTSLLFLHWLGEDSSAPPFSPVFESFGGRRKLESKRSIKAKP